ncbi:RNA chaperone Hfq, partial [Dysosmobacter welbionis]
RRSGGQVRIQHTLFSQHIEQPGQADGDARAGKLAVRVILRQIVVPAAGTDGADLGVIQQGGLVDGAGVVVQAPGDGQVHGEI